MIKKEDIIKKLKEVKDPEIGLDIWTLELVRGIKIDDEGVEILMTLTTPLCPFADTILKTVEDSVGELFADNDLRHARVEFSFNPSWKPSEKLRAMLGI